MWTDIKILAMNNFQELKRITGFDLLWLPITILVVAFLLFGNGLKGDFLLDDGRSIFPSPRIRTLADIPNEFLKPYYHFQPTTGLYRPITQISFVLNLSISDRPIFFHLVNILLHVINTWLIFILIFLVFSSRRLAYITAGVFLFMPIHVEAVTYIAGRADLLALFFCLLSFLLFYSNKLWLAAVVFLLAIFSKEVAIGFPLFLLFYLYAFGGWGLKSLFKKLLPFVLMGLIYVVFRFLALGQNFLANDNGPIANPLTITDWPTRILTGFKLLSLYIWKSFVPVHLSADYGYNQISVVRSLLNIQVLGGVILILGIFALIFHKKTRRSPLAFGTALFLILYFPISNLIFPIGTIIAERFIYAGSLGLGIMVAFLLNRLYAHKKIKSLVCVLLIGMMLIYGIRIIDRNRVWLNEKALITSMAKDSPNSISAKYNLGLYYLTHGRREDGVKLIKESNELAEKAKKDLTASGLD